MDEFVYDLRCRQFAEAWSSEVGQVAQRLLIERIAFAIAHGGGNVWTIECPTTTPDAGHVVAISTDSEVGYDVIDVQDTRDERESEIVAQCATLDELIADLRARRQVFEMA